MSVLLAILALANQTPGPDSVAAERAMERAVRFFRSSVACNGGYLWRYSADLSKREGEGKAEPDCVWVQPPGTPAVGMAYLRAYESTRRPYLLDAAREAGGCLVRGQLRSGGWAREIRFDPAARKRYAYRTDELPPGALNVSTLDDDMSQSAIRFLVHLDHVLGGRDRVVREAADYALDAIIGAQHPNGAWPQGFSAPNRSSGRPVKAASFPAQWSRVHPGGRYWDHYTLNDDVMGTTIATLLDAHDVRGEARLRDAAVRGGDFLILAQLPDPQPGWAQQYDADMHPSWARKFEPPAITGGESQQVMRILIALAERTGQTRFLAPIPKALAYYRRLLLPDGRLARFYEIGTDRPLYFTRAYNLTYDDGDTPTHYSFKVGSRLDAIERELRRVSELIRAGKAPLKPTPAAGTPPSAEAVRQVIAELDDRGAWVESGRLQYHGDTDDTDRIISCETFIGNLDTLSRFIAAERARVSRTSSRTPNAKHKVRVDTDGDQR